MIRYLIKMYFLQVPIQLNTPKQFFIIVNVIHYSKLTANTYVYFKHIMCTILCIILYVTHRILFEYIIRFSVTQFRTIKLLKEKVGKKSK